MKTISIVVAALSVATAAEARTYNYTCNKNGSFVLDVENGLLVTNGLRFTNIQQTEDCQASFVGKSGQWNAEVCLSTKGYATLTLKDHKEETKFECNREVTIPEAKYLCAGFLTSKKTAPVTFGFALGNKNFVVNLPGGPTLKFPVQHGDWQTDHPDVAELQGWRVHDILVPIDHDDESDRFTEDEHRMSDAAQSGRLHLSPTESYSIDAVCIKN